MKILMLFFILSVLSMYACGNSTNNKQQTKFIADGEKESLFSTSLLSGTSWTADLSNDERIYKISFTDTTYITNTFYSATKHDYVATYSYYLSNTKPQQFDWTKVGQKTSGDIIIYITRLQKTRR